MKKYTFDINYILSGLIIYFSLVFYIDYRLSFNIESEWLIAAAIWFIVVGYFKFKKYFDYVLMIAALILFQVAIVDLVDPLYLQYSIPQLKPWLSVGSIIQFEKIYQFVFWTYKYLFVIRGSIPKNFDFYLAIVSYFFVARLIYPIICSKKYYPFVLLIIPVFSLIWVVGDQVSPLVYNALFIGLIYFFIVKGVTGQVYLSKEFGESMSYPKGAVAFVGISVSLIIVLLANGSVAISQREKINDIVGDYMPSVFQLRNEYRADTNQFFDFSSTIYQTGEKLGGSVQGDLWREVMTIETDDDLYYIKGFVSNVYDGKRWTTSNGTYFNQLKFVDQWKGESIVEAMNATITYTGLEANTVFAPKGMISTSLDYERLFSNSDQVSYYKQGIIRRNLESFEVTFSNNDRHLDENVDYLTVPDTVTDWVKIKTRSLLTNSDTDRGKMEAIVKYLQDNYVYRLDMEDTPYDKDFVSYFLSEQGGGYCTYFASSTAIMGRIAGIPTRYVEGYIRPTYPDRGSTYVVRSKHAHAWVEAYIDGEGWVVFDGTPIAPDIDFRSDNYGEDMELDALMGLTDLDEIDNIASDVRGLQEETADENTGLVSNMVRGGFNFIVFGLVLIIVPLIWLIYRWRGRYDQFYRSSELKKMIFRKIYYSYGLYLSLESANNNLTIRELFKQYDINDDIIVLIEKILYGHYPLSALDIQPINQLVEGAEEAYKATNGQMALWKVKYIKYDDIINHQSLKLELNNGSIE